MVKRQNKGPNALNRNNTDYTSKVSIQESGPLDNRGSSVFHPLKLVQTPLKPLLICIKHPKTGHQQNCPKCHP